MVITETKLKGAFVIELDQFKDTRGFFARAWSDREFAAAGLTASFVESNLSFNEKKGTLRGMHYQLPPYEQVKLVRCTRGSIYDVIIDLRPSSPTFKQWFALEMSADNYRMLYVPGEFAHGYLTLDDDTEVLYQTSSYYAPEHGRGVRWNDPAFNISWPADPLIIIDRDRNYEDFLNG
jgi:dTDP-4-dehydrorhamnose 3,5-epimerase